MELTAGVESLPGVGRYYAAKLHRLGLVTLDDLINHFPARYLDYGHPTAVAQLRLETEQCLRVRLKSKARVNTRRGQKMIVAQFADDTGKITAVWFNQDYLLASLDVGEEYYLAGRPTLDKTRHTSLVAPTLEPVTRGGIFTTGLVPVYPLTEGLRSRFLQQKIAIVLDQVKPEEFLELEDINRLDLVANPVAYETVHRPKMAAEFESARKRLAFNDLLAIQLKSALSRAVWRRKEAPAVAVPDTLWQEFTASLPFRLTADQTRVLGEVRKDISRKMAMNRLLQGDVGSGKTVVAAAAMLAAVRAGYQALLMTPTQVLAGQHLETIARFLAPFGVTPQLVTGGKKTTSSSPLLIGTHALLHRSKLIDPEKLGLLVIDEQHRFGVLQRTQFLAGKKVPHLLTMTATPIPRTIALSLYGHLELSFLKTKPLGRKQIKTWLVPEEKRFAAYTWVKRELKQSGHQAFVVCPFVEQSQTDTLKNIKAATVEFDRIKKIFAPLKAGLLHGRMKAEEKSRVLAEFAARKFQLLVTTPVVEVGVDIPGASVMIIEDAPKFGLAALHQLRGRVGRSDQQAYCLLFSGKDDPEAFVRLKLMETTDDGLKLAEADLRVRGPGEIFGTSQSGHLDTNFGYFWDEALQTAAKNLATKLMKTPRRGQQILKLLAPSLAKDSASN